MLLRLLIILLAFSFEIKTVNAQVVARVGSADITLEDFKRRYDEVKNQTINPPSPEVFLEDLVRFEVGVQEAEKMKLREDPIVKERFKTELYKALLEKTIGGQVDKIKVNESEMQTFYKSNPEIRTSHILIEFKPGAKDAEKVGARKRAEEIYKEVRASSRPFEELVKLYSDDSLSKTTGGDIGYQSRLTLVPTYYDAALKLKDGQISGIVETRYGFHILKLTGKRAYQQANKRQVRAAVYDQKRKVVFDNYFAKIKKNYKVDLKKEVLRDLK